VPPPPPTQERPPAAPRAKSGVTKVALVIAGLALVLAIAVLVAGRVELGSFLPGILLVAALAIIAAFFMLRSRQSGPRKAIVVAAIVLVIAVAVPASLKVVYPVYNHFFGQTSAQASGAGNAGPGSEAGAPSSGSGAGAPSSGSGAKAPKSGILVRSTGGSSLNFGYIDPSTGKYTVVSSFNASAPANSGDPDSLALSPDLTKYGTSKVDTSAPGCPGNCPSRLGWIDTSGKFTAVSPAPPPATDFQQSLPPTYSSPVFDGAGNFYYWSHQGQTDHLYKLPPGSTSNAQEVTPTPKPGMGAYRNFDGTIKFGCQNLAGMWLGPDSRMAVSTTIGLPGSPTNPASSGEAIVKYPLTQDMDGCPWIDQSNNQNAVKIFDLGMQVVDQPVASPDGKKIAFFNNNTPGGLYVLDIGGNSQPTRIAAKSDLSSLGNLKVIRWN
jgi:hypothetical protein